MKKRSVSKAATDKYSLKHIPLQIGDRTTTRPHTSTVRHKAIPQDFMLQDPCAHPSSAYLHKEKQTRGDIQDNAAMQYTFSLNKQAHQIKKKQHPSKSHMKNNSKKKRKKKKTCGPLICSQRSINRLFPLCVFSPIDICPPFPYTKKRPHYRRSKQTKKKCIYHSI